MKRDVQCAAWRKSLRSRDNNPIASDFDLDRNQCAARARSAGAFTSVWFVKGAMRSAGQKSTIGTEEFVWPPIERCSGMRAIVDISMVTPAEIYDEALDKPVAPQNMKFRRVAGGISSQGADHIVGCAGKSRATSVGFILSSSSCPRGMQPSVIVYLGPAFSSYRHGKRAHGPPYCRQFPIEFFGLEPKFSMSI